MHENPRLKVPPASRGNRAGALSVPLAKRGEPEEGGNRELWLGDWYDTTTQTNHRQTHKRTLGTGASLLILVQQ